MGDWDFKDLTFNNLSKTFPDNSKIKNPSKNIKTKITEDFLEDFEKFVLENKYADNLSYIYNRDKYYLNNFKTDFKYAIIFILEIDEKVIITDTSKEAQQFNDNFYEKFGNYTYAISDYLRENGYETYVSHPKDDEINFTEMAKDAGLGDIGQSGLLISPENGPNQKISAILVNIDNLPITRNNMHSWIQKYCNICGGTCIKKCPEKALVKHQNKIDLIDSKCLGCSEGCTVCISSCPFYKKGYNEIKRIFNKLY